eukprot:scaffold24508_cov66-Phaeocystis_antarctica.AAC.1
MGVSCSNCCTNCSAAFVGASCAALAFANCRSNSAAAFSITAAASLSATSATTFSAATFSADTGVGAAVDAKCFPASVRPAPATPRNPWRCPAEGRVVARPTRAVITVITEL